MTLSCRATILVVAMVVLPMPGFAPSAQDAPATVSAEPIVTVVHVPLRREGDLQRLFLGEFNVTDRAGDLVEIYASDGDLARLRDMGFTWTPVGQQPIPPPVTSDVKGLGGYNDYASVTDLLEDFASDFPAITRLESLGQSVQGRELWALLITDNPDDDEEEPEFKYVSTMHGDEPVGTEMCLFFIDRLLQGYGSETRVTELVNDTAIWIVPLMNPDGLMLGTRANAQSVDLNRNFPTFGTHFAESYFDGGAVSLTGRQAEVAHVMNWTLENSFVLSANFHTGAQVVNFPYDYTPGIPSGFDAPSPDDALFRDVSLRYSLPNPMLFNSVEFLYGITNGSAWFSITGGMQDWNLRFAGCMDVTLELSNVKRPEASTIDDFWEANEESMFAYLEAVHIGIRGLVTDERTGDPLWAKVVIDDNPQQIFTDSDVGDYYRLTLPGTYDLVVQAAGHIGRKVDGVVVNEGPATRVDVSLSDGDVDGDGSAGAADLQTIINRLLDGACPIDCDLDGGTLTATDLQALLNLILTAPAR